VCRAEVERWWQVSAERNTTDLYDRVVASCWTDTQVADIGQYLNITVKQKLGNAPKKGSLLFFFNGFLFYFSVFIFSN
jgi:hypothetical protein